jgi:predicted AAA+ superfamily ATPase
MIERPIWKERLKSSWKEAPIVWLCGVRQVGKTTLAQSLENALYVNCDLPATEERVSDPELFFKSCKHPVIVFDEIHQLRDPTRLLKIGADLFPSLKILATGSSTLAASEKFRDTLTGRKRTVHMVPVLWDELASFGATLPDRLYLGGLPRSLQSGTKRPSFYREWMDSFFARDIQRLFGFRDFNRFNALFEYILRQSGGQLEVSKTASAVGVSRPTVDSHLRALELTHAITVVRPFHGGKQAELVKQPKVYGFDTGFVSFLRGWDPLRSEDMGFLWEHLVLEYLQAHFPETPIRYWRDKAGREVDFVITWGREEADAIECKWDAKTFDAAALRVFRSRHPQGRNFLITPSASPGYLKKCGNLKIRVCSPDGLKF